MERIEAARPRWIPATVLLREIRERGYAGGISQLKAFLAPLKQARIDPVVRFETAPGEQMQADFTVDPPRPRSAARVRGDAGLQPGDASCASRRARTRRRCVAACARRFEYFGGVPQHVLFDNAKTIVIERDAYGEGTAPLAPRAARAGR